MTKFAKVHIVCAAPFNIETGRVTMLASACDTRVFVVTDDGAEHDLIVDSIEWSVKCDGEPARATIRLFPDAVNVDAVAAITDGKTDA